MVVSKVEMHKQVQQERCLPRGLAGKPRPARSDRAKTRVLWLVGLNEDRRGCRLRLYELELRRCIYCSTAAHA
jgi:hypothetical protein